jgi:hypothetical protein
MRLLTTILLFWPIIAIGGTRPDALPPWGLWECKWERGFSCYWEDQSKRPHCSLDEKDIFFEGNAFRINLESSPYTITNFELGGEIGKLHYLGPEDGVWTLSAAPLRVFGINPNNGKYRGVINVWGSIVIIEGTCINITPKDEEKKPAIESKDKGTCESSAKD